LLVAANIVWSGVQLVRRSTQGLMDAALSPEEVNQIDATLQPFRDKGLEFHALRTRQAGTRRFMSVHVLMPGHWTIQHGHKVADSIEDALAKALPGMVASTHLEPLNDPSSMADQTLDRTG
jgi:divalent metal cation (Fe/Co/Zn/Cd) transporter